MVRVIRSGCILACLVVGLYASGAGELSENQIRDLAWQFLKPHTLSRNLSHCMFFDARSVTGRKMAERFAGEPALGRWQDPSFEENLEIRPYQTYWYVHLKPRDATPLPTPTISPAASPNIPEPYIDQAFFLLDQADQRNWFGEKMRNCRYRFEAVSFMW